MTNEIIPRAKKLGLTLDEFLDPKVSRLISLLEYEGYITRCQTREILDKTVSYHKESMLETIS